MGILFVFVCMYVYENMGSVSVGVDNTWLHCSIETSWYKNAAGVKFVVLLGLMAQWRKNAFFLFLIGKTFQQLQWFYAISLTHPRVPPPTIDKRLSKIGTEKRLRDFTRSAYLISYCHNTRYIYDIALNFGRYELWNRFPRNVLRFFL